MSDGNGNTPGEIIRNIILFVLIGVGLFIAGMFLVNDLNADRDQSTEGAGSMSARSWER